VYRGPIRYTTSEHFHKEGFVGTLHHRIDAPCAPERVWDVLSDLVAVQRYNPTVAAARFRGTQRQGVGAERECDLRPNGLVVERVTVWEEKRALGLEVVESPWPFPFMRWTTRIEPHGAGTRITQDLEYRMKFGPLGWLLDRLVLRRRLRTTLDEVFRNLVATAA
jgi:ligand-binding SRPBCC domain-containing protein